MFGISRLAENVMSSSVNLHQELERTRTHGAEVPEDQDRETMI